MLDVATLTDGGQPVTVVAQRLHDFLSAARETLDIAIYDLNLGPGTEELVVGALEAAGARGVAVRLAYNADHRNPIPVPPPPECAPEDIARLHVPTRAIAGI